MGKVIKDGNKDLFRHATFAPEKRKYFINMMDLFQREMIREWGEEEKVLMVSEGNDKADVPSYSTMPGFTCMHNGKYPPCFTSGNCYALSDLRNFKVVEKCVHNTVLILKYPEAFRKSYRCHNEIGMQRLHVEGDFVNETELDIINSETKTITMTYTKQTDMCNRYFKTHKKNPNLVLLYSAWEGMEIENPHGFPVCRVYRTANEYINGQGERKCGRLERKGDEYEFTKGKCSKCLFRHLMGNGNGGCYDGKDIDMLAH